MAAGVAGRPAPFGPSTVSVGIYPTGPTAIEMVRSIRRQGRAAESAGFDGVTVSEHHAGFPYYMPQPLQACEWILSDTSRVWTSPLPTLLLLRNPRLFIEELAWTAARHPGRVAVAVAAGYIAADFTATGALFDTSATTFEGGLTALREAMAPESELVSDPAVAALAAVPIPVLSVGNSVTAARRAARHGLGLALTGGGDRGRLIDMAEAYVSGGGAGPLVLVRRVWFGEVPPGTTEAVKAAYPASSPSITAAATTGQSLFLSGGPDEIVDAIAEECEAIGAQTVNLRAHIPGAPVESLTAQIDALGGEVAPRLSVVLST